jgi:hypothetical protein
MSAFLRSSKIELSLGTMHAGQVRAYWALHGSRFKALRCGRRFGKTDFGKMWIVQGLAQGWGCAWFSPQHMTSSEVYSELSDSLRPIIDTSSKAQAVMRLKTGGRLDFWSLENAIAGRGRRYRRIVIDEAAFAKDGDNKVDGSMMSIWEKAIKPTLFDYGGRFWSAQTPREKIRTTSFTIYAPINSTALSSTTPRPETIQFFRSNRKTRVLRTGLNDENGTSPT